MLLFGPCRGVDPDSGDVSYTEALLGNPPPGVEYTSYLDAFSSGLVRLRGRRPKHERPRAADAMLLPVRGAERLLRASGLMFQEPTWFVTIEDGAFDLVHQHVFAVRQIGNRLPVVSSAGYPLPVLYRARQGWGTKRLRLATALERWYAHLLDIHNPWIRGSPGQVMTVYTEHFRDQLVAAGADPDRVMVCGTAAPDHGIPPKRRNGGVTLGFIGRDFLLKGGDVVVDAYARLRATHPELRLVIITGTRGAEQSPDCDGIEISTDAPHAEVLSRYLPEIDVLVLPTRSDCGVPYSMLEALQSGACVITSTLPWLDERLRQPAVIRTEADSNSVRAAMEELLRPGALDVAQDAARALWRQHFSMERLHGCLLDAYRQAVGQP